MLPRSRFSRLALLLALVCPRPLPAADATAPPPTLVVTTSMLACAARELAPGDDRLRLVTMVPPGTCPGHFDLSPRLVPELRAAVAVVRHDFQAPLGAAVERLAGGDVAVVAVASEGGLTVPGHYLGLVRQLAGELGRVLPERRPELEAALARVSLRLEGLEAEVRARPAPWRGAPVIASAHQAELCSWLGLEVVAELGRAEDTTLRGLEGLLGERPAMVVGNLQEGPQAALSLGQRLGRPVAVLSNFPGAPGYGATFDELLRANLDRLDAAWASR